MHYVDEGPVGGPPVLLLHGEPSWGYLYRHMIPPLVDAGFRVVVPDQVGFGRSDKPTDPAGYSYARHVGWMSALVFDELDLHDVTFFGQDWGGLIGLRLVAADPDRFARVVVANTGLPTGDHRTSEAFRAWTRYAATSPSFSPGRIIENGTTTSLPPEVVAAYDAPFPDDTFLAGARVWPSLVPTAPDDPEAPAQRAAWEVLRTLERPFLCCFSDRDPVTRGADRPFRRLIPGATGQPHTTMQGGGHFLQEDCGPELAALLAEFANAG